MSAGRGLLVVFNIAEGRPGSQNDGQNLADTFKLMGAEVETEINASEVEIKRVMERLKKKNFEDYLYIAIAYLSHGSEDGIVKTKTEIIKLQKTILIPLCNIPELNGKLKWLIMQTCRGHYDFIKDATEGPVATIAYPRYCAKFFATTEGTKAYRYATGEGSWFISALCERLRNEFLNNDILSIMANAAADVVNQCKSNQCIIQMPCSEDNFGNKKFKILSGFSEF